jgi:hypothetical protein
MRRSFRRSHRPALRAVELLGSKWQPAGFACGLNAGVSGRGGLPRGKHPPASAASKCF